LYFIMHPILLKITSHPASQRLTMEMSECAQAVPFRVPLKTFSGI